MMNILKWPNKILTTKAEPVEKVDEEINKIIDEMLNVMLSNNALGLAANQVGILKRIIVANVDKEQLLVLVNPQIQIDESTLGLHKEEGCLSLPGAQTKLKRASAIKVVGLGRDNEEITYELFDLDAIVIQHEVDHLDGITMLQRANFTQKDFIKKQMKKWDRYVKRKEKKTIREPSKSSRTRRRELPVTKEKTS
jgi:peptide deformylase